MRLLGRKSVGVRSLPPPGQNLQLTQSLGRCTCRRRRPSRRCKHSQHVWWYSSVSSQDHYHRHKHGLLFAVTYGAIMARAFRTGIDISSLVRAGTACSHFCSSRSSLAPFNMQVCVSSSKPTVETLVCISCLSLTVLRVPRAGVRCLACCHDDRRTSRGVGK